MLNGNRIVYTVTFNPALDYRVILKKFQAGILNRAYQTKFLVGGKGIRVFGRVYGRRDRKSVVGSRM